MRPDGGAPDTPGWRIRVVPNKYPALAGMHEVIVHSPDHEAELEDLGDEGLLEVLEVWRGASPRSSTPARPPPR